jgi:hypothetical protein
MAPRPGGLNPWKGNDAKQLQIQRRFQLLGMTVDGMRVWDIRCAIQVLRQECPNLKELRLRARSRAETLVLLASLFEPPVSRIQVPSIAPERDQQPSILNLTRTIPLEILPVLAALRSDVINASTAEEAEFAAKVTQDPAWTGHSITFGNMD